MLPRTMTTKAKDSMKETEMLKRTFPIVAALTALAGPAIAAGLHCPMVRINGLMIGPGDVYPTGDGRAWAQVEDALKLPA